MRFCRFTAAATLITLLASGLPTQRAAAQNPPAAVSAVGSEITADSAPYRIEWNGATGLFLRKAFGQEAESRQSLVFLHSDPGPTGYAKHLAWFLARDDHGFSLVWCYLNDAGVEFDCWLYRFPSNQLTSLHFTGPYRFTPPKEPAPAVPLPTFKIDSFPAYNGPDFAYRGWTKLAGGLPALDLRPARAAGAPAPANSTDAPIKTLSQMLVRPLHHIEVGSANGWRDGGWNELHALASDAAKDPYYLILYSNTSSGYAVDLKRAQIYTADFGTKVTFTDPGQFGPQDNPLNIEPEIKVKRYDRHEIVLTTTAKSANPYADIQVGVEFKGPDAKTVLVPGFWDGGSTFRVRFTPTLRGVWTWRSRSEVSSDLNGQTGVFECIGEDPGVKGFVKVQPNHKNPRHFAYSNGDAFLPVYVREPQAPYVALSGSGSSAANTGGAVKVTALTSPQEQDETASFIVYQRFINAASQRGFNRLVGGAILSPAAARMIRANEGGAASHSAALDSINPAFFQWMDRRIAYANAHGIVPDVGLGTLEDSMFTAYDPKALFRLWSYVVARYASFDVHWTLTDLGTAPASRKNAEQFSELTRLLDPNLHPLTTIVAGGTAPAPAPAVTQPRPAGRTGGTGRPTGGPGSFRLGGGAPPSGAATPAARQSGSALSGAIQAPTVSSAAYDVPWQDVITILGGDVKALPSYSAVEKPVVLLERAAVGKDAALNPDVARHRMWEARMQGAYWAPGAVPTADAAGLDAPEIRYAQYCADLFRKTRFYRLAPRPEMLGGPAESQADKRRRKRAELLALRNNPPPVDDTVAPDFDPFDPDPFASLPPLPKPTPMFVLVDPAREYVVYFEQGGTLLLDLLEATGKVQTTWFNPRTGEFTATRQIAGGAYTSFTAPDSNDWVLYVARL